jgi:hypothetical protein
LELLGLGARSGLLHRYVVQSPLRKIGINGGPRSNEAYENRIPYPIGQGNNLFRPGRGLRGLLRTIKSQHGSPSGYAGLRFLYLNLKRCQVLTKTVQPKRQFWLGQAYQRNGWRAKIGGWVGGAEGRIECGHEFPATRVVAKGSRKIIYVKWRCWIPLVSCCRGRWGSGPAI